MDVSPSRVDRILHSWAHSRLRTPSQRRGPNSGPISRTLLVAVGALMISPAGWCSDGVRGDSTQFQSPNGVLERCVRLAAMPGGRYTEKDLEKEEEYCSLDLYDPEIALCPKIWSTSPGVVLYDISEGDYAQRRDDFERLACSEGKGAKALAKDTHAKLKPTLNAPGTSGTFSTASLLYYHFSRYFDTAVRVPVAVWRSFDRQAFLTEVALPGVANSGHRHSSQMNHVGWQVLAAVAETPEGYQPTDEIFTADRAQVYGALLSSPGHRYNSVVNGTRRSGWGRGQNLDFQQTAPYLALRSPEAIREAITAGLEGARDDAQLQRDLGEEVSELQMLFWMREISEIVLLDYIFSQQDRVGNIDFTAHWYWLDGGEIEHSSASHHHAAPSPSPTAVLIKRTRLNDNDAAGRIAYANFSKSTQMLEKLRHFSAGVYGRLVALDADFQRGGPLLTYVRDTFGLEPRQVEQIVANTRLATGILRATCRQGELRFDLEPEEFLASGAVAPVEQACEMP